MAHCVANAGSSKLVEKCDCDALFLKAWKRDLHRPVHADVRAAAFKFTHVMLLYGSDSLFADESLADALRLAVADENMNVLAAAVGIIVCIWTDSRNETRSADSSDGTCRAVSEIVRRLLHVESSPSDVPPSERADAHRCEAAELLAHQNAVQDSIVIGHNDDVAADDALRHLLCALSSVDFCTSKLEPTRDRLYDFCIAFLSSARARNTALAEAAAHLLITLSAHRARSGSADAHGPSSTGAHHAALSRLCRLLCESAFASARDQPFSRLCAAPRVTLMCAIEWSAVEVAHIAAALGTWAISCAMQADAKAARALTDGFSVLARFSAPAKAHSCSTSMWSQSERAGCSLLLHPTATTALLGAVQLCLARSAGRMRAWQCTATQSYAVALQAVELGKRLCEIGGAIAFDGRLQAALDIAVRGKDRVGDAHDLADETAVDSLIHFCAAQLTLSSAPRLVIVALHLLTSINSANPCASVHARIAELTVRCLTHAGALPRLIAVGACWERRDMADCQR